MSTRDHKSELEHMAYANDETPSTGRIERAVAHALHMFGLLKMQKDVERAAEDARAAWATAQRIEKRQLRAHAAASAAYQSEIKDIED